MCSSPRSRPARCLARLSRAQSKSSTSWNRPTAASTAGTVGYFDFSGNMDMAIAIRTAFLRDHEASVQGRCPALCSTPVPATEWQETRNKAEASVESIQIAAQLREL